MLWLDATVFPKMTTPSSLPDGEVHLWLWNHETPSGVAANDRLKALLAAYLDIDPARLPLRRTAHGKPFLEGLPNLHFNLSHSGTCTAIALSRDVEPGVDVEVPRRQRSLLPLAQRFFATSEVAVLQALPEAIRHSAFHALWTCKEAVLKAQGRGIAFGLHRLSFELSLDRGDVLGLTQIDVEAGSAAQWQLRRFAPTAQGFGALAWRGAALPIRGFRGIV
jgi:4'-phosphopantetheinyl transferase